MLQVIFLALDDQSQMLPLAVLAPVHLRDPQGERARLTVDAENPTGAKKLHPAGVPPAPGFPDAGIL